MDTNISILLCGITEKIIREYSPEKIFLFGSFANGRPGPDSDIDLLIIKDTSERPIDRRVAVSTILSDPARLIPIDALVLTPGEVEERLRKQDQFIQEIIEEGKLLYAA